MSSRCERIIIAILLIVLSSCVEMALVRAAS